MDILVWLLWALLAFLGVLWKLVWFLISGWVATLLQVAVLIAAIFFFTYGWQRAPGELLRRARTVTGLVWAWMRTREVGAAAPAGTREFVRVVRIKEFGNVNISTLLSLLMLAGLALLTTLR